MQEKRNRIILLFNANKGYDRQIIKGVGYFLQATQVNWDIYIADDFRADFKNFPVLTGDGIIANFDDPDIVDLLTDIEMPIIGVGASYSHPQDYPSVPYVAVDNDALIEKAFDHLYSKGIKDFAFYSIPPSKYCRWATERENSFNQILTKKGLSGSIYQGMETTLDNWQQAQKELVDWITSLPQNTGIIAVNDARARHILQTCDHMGLKIPEQYCVIGIDDEDIINYLSLVTLSTIAQGTEEMGYKAASMLQKLLLHKDIGMPRVLVGPKTIIERRSTDYRSVHDPYVMQAIHFIRNHACSGIKTEQVLAEVRLSRSNLESRFKAELGKTIHNVIHEEKFEKAKYLLVHTTLSINEIYQMCGYPSLQYFYFLFKKHYNQTPKEYREQGTHHLNI
ncbi:XylR family transcriptional regulator [Zophobihabitans entericus]|uniref:Substrate-binding domain-containing protein n=1 Tax=Zophobihabitans entericus TaxID=1635327 RepID=A0A6G9IAK0_9GAMM|nr:DNA-binding transcriptional regulator [Zophobihabitans entericus]QIQ21243.1 substrate-binding domain-containing protein [Zophobihabitans entericus]